MNIPVNEIEDAYDNDNAEIIVEHLCGNLIGQSIMILNASVSPSLDLNEGFWTEVLVEKVDNGYLYGVCNGNKVDIYLPYVYVYHPAVLAALKML
jgi:hypothetical protein